MRPSFFLFLFFTVIFVVDSCMAIGSRQLRTEKRESSAELQRLVGELGITDLCLSTEARYTRHLAVSDRTVPFMDHPGAIEHFPSGSFFYPAFLP